MKSIKAKLHEVIFEADTFAGKAFDLGLLLAILISILAVMLDSVDVVHANYGDELAVVEWVCTILFTIEYILRFWIIDKSWRYVFSFYGIIDFLSTIPSYITLFFVGAPSLILLRSFRLLRIFRILRLVDYLGEARVLVDSIKASGRKILVFTMAVIMISIFMGSLMYQVEGPANGFTSIPKSIYWAIVTLTTVGYGDIAPQTVIGQTIASIIMILGYGIIAVPTGIVGVEIAKSEIKRKFSTQTCPSCAQEGHDYDAIFCKFCGEKL